MNPRKKEITDFIGWISVEKVKEIFNKLKEKGWKVPKVKDYPWLESEDIYIVWDKVRFKKDGIVYALPKKLVPKVLSFQ
ncbi:hypothetical protein QDY65_03005 [Pyrococcus kukulkanii]|uniref:Uncharacterized protein n=1 Tax=Pyrococcus kukulkanii TaxID=1609559 RepID=A0A127B8K7_9EURY|nr:hypothetical protein [Pyrococcus kukulkanii]AMM53700.1 hypothetical protein TQ32_03815 [Pyrococcus kukulkanii]